MIMGEKLFPSQITSSSEYKVGVQTLPVLSGVVTFKYF